MEEEEDPSIVGAGVLARRVTDIRPPGDNGGASAARGVAIATSQVGTEGHFDFRDAVRLSGGEYGDPPRVNWAHAGKDPVPLAQEGDQYGPVRSVSAGEVVDLRAVREGLLRERDRFV